MAAIAWLPARSKEVVKLTAPPESVPVPRFVLPSKKVTVPVGAPRPGVALTIADKVTDWPNTDGLADDTRVVLVLAWITVWMKAAGAPTQWPAICPADNAVG